MIAVVDYGAGNLGSVVNALEHLGVPHVVTDDPATILGAAGVIFPGVGATADSMRNLRERGLVGVLRAVAEGGRPLFGVCVGQQVLFDTSYEGDPHPCLGILGGEVRRFPDTDDLIVPHMGWNGVTLRRPHPLFAGIPDGTEFYFVHSYYCAPDDEAIVLGETDYGAPFAAAIARGNVMATQFHPEKSGRWGLQLYRNFAHLVADRLTLPEAAVATGRSA
ncbi:MAG: Imidazole glycerol phosphate synthase amidotransferase subunit [uncultured Thermomicrobiales bacterium]|uniref:Imidazole glycerol phosphate synthase subunit HisH n=1 Tax=uncultured Thermomicrobiales bacterium TaxID=1645740 RepID=A0A6J4V5D3_9BACT|nr:MAG: Imidazole glycerol phosphate synthase amidotransferase subunit [uncultured Thermomicrobiales bacterium]